MTESGFPKTPDPNQQIYQRLKLALSLNLRRQIFVAVCDDLRLRDRFVAQLATELASGKSTAAADGSSGNTSKSYPKLVDLELDLQDPNPIAQMAQWLTQFPPPKTGSRRAAMPAFQIVGVERLTRQSAAMQRLFYTHLQAIERNLPLLESSLVLWVTQPWLRSLPQSAPEFWRCRTGVFEFVGDPTPLPTAPPERVQPTRAQPIAESAPPLPDLPKTTPQSDLWDSLLQDLSSVRQPLADRQSPPERGAPPETNSPAADPVLDPVLNGAAAHTSAKQTPGAVALQAERNGRSHSTVERVEPPDLASSDAELDNPFQLPEELFADTPSDTRMLPLMLEVLHQQQASPDVLADAYRNLGNLYRDRVEQGDASVQNLTMAIQAYEQALLWLPDASQQRVDVLNDLGNIYWMMARSNDRPDLGLSYLKQGIQSYQSALASIDAQTQAATYAMVQNNLGAAYADLARHQDPAQNLQRSVQSYRQALSYRDANTDPTRYASTQNNLGTTYWNLAQYQQPEVNLKLSIAAYSEALHHYDPQQEPLNYAMIQNNLGTAYWNLAQYERAKDWLPLALAAYRVALQYRTQEVTPTGYAATQNNLGTAYWHMANQLEDPHQRVEYLQQAITAYELTLTTGQQFVQGQALNFDLFATHNNLGLAHFQLATTLQAGLKIDTQRHHLQLALKHHILAVQGWAERPDLRQTAMSCVTQTVRAFYTQLGLEGQNIALSSIPSSLLPEILPKL